MTIKYFLDLSNQDQDDMISNCGNILINYLQGEYIVHIYKVHDFFVKVISTGEGLINLEAYSHLDNLRLFEPAHFI